MKKRANQILIALTAAAAALIVHRAGHRQIRVFRGEKPASGARLEPLGGSGDGTAGPSVLDDQGTLELPWGIWREPATFAFANGGRVWLLSTPAIGQRIYRIVDGGIDVRDTVDFTFYRWTSRVEQRDA